MLFRVVSWNLHGPPLAPRQEERFRLAAERILADTTTPPDLVMLQEVWYPSMADLLLERLGSRFIPIDTPRNWFPGRAGGLLSLVRRDSGWSIRESVFEPFSASAPAHRFWQGDGLAGKGFQRVTLEAGRDHVVFFNTHLQAEYGDLAYTDVRTEQVRQLNRAAAALDAELPVLACGDFNTRPEEPLYSELTSGWADLTQPLRVQCGCGTTVPRENAPEWIDYMLLRRGGSWAGQVVRASRIESASTDLPYSDHHGLELEIRLDRSLALGAAARAAGVLALNGPSTRRQWIGGLALLALGLRLPD